jgi:uncharacterized membrane protein YdjX (TVP38/TMEM64 family)
MFNYMIVLRIAPLPPNWVANLGAPHLDVPVNAFFWGTFFGMNRSLRSPLVSTLLIPMVFHQEWLVHPLFMYKLVLPWTDYPPRMNFASSRLSTLFAW